MRDFLNAILAFIGSESLTDEEWALVEVEVQEYSQEVYDELKGVLESREAVSSQLDKLTAYFKARGLEASDTDHIPTSQIFVGSPL